MKDTFLLFSLANAAMSTGNGIRACFIWVKEYHVVLTSPF